MPSCAAEGAMSRQLCLSHSKAGQRHLRKQTLLVWVAAEARSYTRRCARSRMWAIAASAQRGRQWAEQTRVLIGELVSMLQSNN